MPSAPLPGPTAAAPADAPAEVAAGVPPRPAARGARGRRALRWALGGLAALAALLLLAAAALWWWLPSDAELARRAGDGAGDWLGVPVTVERLEWQLLPSPRVQLFGVRTEQEEPVTAGRIVADARWSDLLHRRLALTRLRLEDARVPQRSLGTFDVRKAGEETAPRLPFTLADIPVERAEWSGVRWIGRTGRALDYGGSVDFDAQWRPRRAELEREGVQPLTRLRIEREGTEDRWKAEVSAGGRTEQGTLRLQVLGARYRVTGAIDFSGVDVVALLGAFDRRSAVSGLARGHTDLIAEGADAAEAVRALHTRTRFTVVRARLLTFDLERAVRSAGTHKGGTTALDSLSGEVRTEADAADGTIVRYSHLEATSGVLTATGDAVLQNRRVSGHVAVDLVDGVVGVPLEFGGTVDEPTLTLPAAALAGAAVGTVIAPGVGTALGARIGETVRRIFGGGGEEAAPPPKPAQRSRPAR
ncbi:hypothetical protein [Acidovorax sp. NCPPB 4044]|uniref:hypothetical protein n=1 Tax=Acidovorax sp. NCPPB 4044 TaxID=2940490 RepID=UPI002302B7B1|nr:hypothetical protein [Acidovorax sp. NCPPB 4044]MDA8523225.1 hypothetical protein [Acidovorax sp. NCPPB 4044]